MVAYKLEYSVLVSLHLFFHKIENFDLSILRFLKLIFTGNKWNACSFFLLIKGNSIFFIKLIFSIYF